MGVDTLAVVVSVSLTENDFQWLLTHKQDRNCSPTTLLRSAIREMKERIGEDLLPTYKELWDKQQKTLQHFNELRKFVKDRGLENEYWDTKEIQKEE